MKWVDALRTFGATASFTADEVTVGFRLGTDGGDLSDEDLPMATGDESPSVLDLPNEIGVGLRDPAQVFSFGESAAQAVNPQGYSDYQTAKATIERRLDIDIDDDLIGQLEGDASLSVSTQGAVGARIQLADEAAFKRTLSKLEKELPEVAQRVERLDHPPDEGGRLLACCAARTATRSPTPWWTGRW